jgi:ABC-type nitrate/sulfonate/bicarbonate transport system substrate-binding protein
MKTRRFGRGTSVLLGVILVLTTDPANSRAESPAIPKIPRVDVRFGHEPYGDHTQAIIGVKKGWFDEVGINLVDGGKVISSESTIPVFASGQVNVMSGSVPLFLGATRQLPAYKYFFYADMFLGYALMAQPTKGYKSVEEFMATGASREEAIKQAVQQMRGKKFGYPAETAIKGFINLTLARGGLSLSDVQGVIAEDSRTAAMMVSGDVDFQVGGVPSRLTLQTKGFKPIVTSADLASSAKPSADSEELRAVFHDGWGASDKWIKDHYDTVLRLSSVGWRINQFINDQGDEAMDLHIPFLNQAAGTNFDKNTFRVVYQALDPFVPFDKQNDWYNNDNHPMNEKYVVGSHIKSFEERKFFKPGEFKVSDFSIAAKVYNEMTAYKQASEKQIKEAHDLLGGSTPKAKELLDEASKQYNAFNFYDADRFSKAAIEWARFEKK